MRHFNGGLPVLLTGISGFRLAGSLRARFVGFLIAFFMMASFPFLGSLAVSAEPIRIVALGDSLTAGYQLPQKNAFPVVLEAALRAKGLDVTIENAGVSGDTATGGLDRLDWSVADGTRGVILELGANDALRGIDPRITEAALDQIITRLKVRGIKVLLAGMLAPRNNGPAYVAAFDGIFARLAAKHGVPLYPFFLDGVMGNPALVLPDQMHPNPAGVETIVARILPSVVTFVEALKRP